MNRRNREHCFEGYTKEGFSGNNYLKTEDGKFQKPSAKDKRCDHCRYWALHYGNHKDFWCRRRKEHMKKFHPSTRLSEN